MKIALLGYTGFIGKNLGNNLIKNYEVEKISLRQENWQEKINNATVFINLIGKAHDHKGTATKKDFFYANLDLVKEIYKAFVESEAELLIHISSLAAVEEFESDIPLTEDQNCNPQSFYGKSKREAEKWLLEQEIPQNKKVIILRPPMVHGEGDKGNLGLLYKFISKGIPYPLSSFDNKRSFVSIQNFNYFIEKIIENKANLQTGIYHISDDLPISTKEIIDIIKKVTAKNTMNLSLPKSLVKLLAKIGDVVPIPLNTKRLKKMTSDLLVSNQKIKTALRINQLPLSAKEGLEITIKSFKNN